MTSNGKRCENCIHFDPLKNKEKGFCTRYAPKPVVGGEFELKICYTTWPLVGAHARCGEYLSKNSKNF